jgi:DNA-directed RNA polymerase specialized sigma24 family protein
MADGDPASLPLPELCRLCRHETDRYKRGDAADGRFCMEIFRRAIYEKSELCWTELYDIYHDQALSWCRRAGARPSTDRDELLTRAWAKFWRYFTPAKFDEARTVARVLAYLRMCIYTSVVDMVRDTPPQLSLDADLAPPAAVPGPDDDIPAAAHIADFWRLIRGHLLDERERALVYMKYVLEMRPAEISLQRPDLFPTPADVYRIGRNILDRLRRSPDMRRYYENDQE